MVVFIQKNHHFVVHIRNALYLLIINSVIFHFKSGTIIKCYGVYEEKWLLTTEPKGRYVFVPVGKDHLEPMPLHDIVSVGEIPSSITVKANDPAEISVSVNVESTRDDLEITYEWNLNEYVETVSGSLGKFGENTGSTYVFSNLDAGIDRSLLYCDIYVNGSYYDSTGYCMLQVSESAAEVPAVPLQKTNKKSSDTLMREATPEEADNSGASEAELLTANKPADTKLSTGMMVVYSEDYDNDNARCDVHMVVIASASGRENLASSATEASIRSFLGLTSSDKTAKSADGASFITLGNGTICYTWYQNQIEGDKRYVEVKAALLDDTYDSTCSGAGQRSLRYSQYYEAEFSENKYYDYTIPVEHKYGSWTGISADCTKAVYRHTCTECGKNEEKTVTYSAVHEWGEWTLKSMGCTEADYEHKCTRCGASEGKTQKLSSDNHDYSEWKEESRSCTSITYVTTCKRCGLTERETSQFEKVQHRFNDGWVVTLEACEVNGEMKRTCAVCGYEERKEILAVGHKDSDHDLICDKCGYFLATEAFAGDLLGIVEKDDVDDTYRLEVQDAKASRMSLLPEDAPEEIPLLSVDTVLPGSSIVITASVPEDGVFTEWAVDGLELTKEELSADTIRFIMPEEDVTIVALYSCPTPGREPLKPESEEAPEETGPAEETTEAEPETTEPETVVEPAEKKKSNGLLGLLAIPPSLGLMELAVALLYATIVVKELTEEDAAGEKKKVRHASLVIGGKLMVLWVLKDKVTMKTMKTPCDVTIYNTDDTEVKTIADAKRFAIPRNGYAIVTVKGDKETRYKIRFLRMKKKNESEEETR